MGKFAGIKVAEWIPSGSWKDILIGNYDYSYLFIVRPSVWPEIDLLAVCGEVYTLKHPYSVDLS